jgi:hypothetical protein
MERDERGVEGRGWGWFNECLDIFLEGEGEWFEGIYRRNCLIRFSLSTLFKINDRIDLK